MAGEHYPEPESPRACSGQSEELDKEALEEMAKVDLLNVASSTSNTGQGSEAYDVPGTAFYVFVNERTDRLVDGLGNREYWPKIREHVKTQLERELGLRAED